MRNAGLDIMRAAAVFLVLCRHAGLPYESSGFFAFLQRGGWVGVDVFFVLSGFLVSGLLFKESQKTSTINVSRFLIRRGLKLYPAFWVFLLTTVVVNSLTASPMSSRAFWGEMLFLQNYLGGLWGHTWSLAVEEHFYFILAAFIACSVGHKSLESKSCLRDRFAKIPTYFAICAVICLGFRILNIWVFPSYSNRFYLYGTHIRIDSLCFGVLLSYLIHYRDFGARIAGVPSVALVIFGVALLAPAFFVELGAENRWMSIYGVVFNYLGAGFCLLGAIRLRQCSNLLLRVTCSLGAASYSIYLWHLPVQTWGLQNIGQTIVFNSNTIYLLVYLVLTFAFGFLMSKLVEFPVLHVRDRLFPRTTPPMETAHL